MENYRSKVKDICEMLHAIEILEYHNKNYLSWDNKRRCEEKQALLIKALQFNRLDAPNMKSMEINPKRNTDTYVDRNPETKLSGQICTDHGNIYLDIAVKGYVPEEKVRILENLYKKFK